MSNACEYKLLLFYAVEIISVIHQVFPDLPPGARWLHIYPPPTPELVVVLQLARANEMGMEVIHVTSVEALRASA